MMAIVFRSQATHLRAGEITATRVNCNSLTFIITITVYTNTKNTTVLFGGDQDVLNFGDGSKSVFVPETPNTLRPDLDPDGSVATASFTISHTYSGFGTYVISYREPNRNEGVLNMDASVNTTFYLETVVTVDPFLGCNNTPKLLVPPIDHACPGVAWTHNPGAFDPDGDSLSYSMEVPFSDRKTQVINYKNPNDPKFYNNFGNANENGNGPPTFSINPISGTITWDSPGAVGEYNIAFHIIEWRKKGTEWFPMGYVRRDMQILVDDCKNQRPDLIVPKDTCVVAGTVLKATIYGTDPDKDPVKIEAFSEIFNFPPALSPAKYTPVPGVNDFVPSVPPAETKFEWQTECIHVKDQPYQVVFKVTDKPKEGPRLVTFKTWLVKVVGPAPDWTNATLNLSNRTTDLEWAPYFCQNAEKMQVWRKVDGNPFVPDNCQTGMPDYLGYELIDVVDIKDANNVPITKYRDTNNGKGLAPGAKYCYRLVAVFPLPKGGESYVSLDTCVGPIKANVPIITHVTVEKTDMTTGQNRISWRSPFEVDKTQFPPPYRYDVYRTVGFASGRGTDSVKISPVGFSDTTIVDTPINTEENVYNYGVTCYASNGGLVGSSAHASSVRLDAKSQVKKIELNWSAFVPWSNQIQTVPNKHLIYRGPEGATEADLVLIDSVDVLNSGFIYLDQGQWDGKGLNDNDVYCYRVMTRGGYGNPKIAQPLLNFSQIMCAQPGDTIPPCKLEPPIRSTVEYKDCDDYFQQFCDRNTFSNTLIWNRPEDSDCRNDVRSYNIYYTNKRGGEYTLLANTKDTTYTDTKNLRSFARCYKIAAVDRSGNEGELSEEMCIDNCPYYELPNVFTPNGDKYNETFSAFSTRNIPCGEEGGCPIPDELKLKCARFVEQVEFKVFNRWGQEVYTYDSSIGDNTASIYIDWNGKDAGGKELATGVYYYVAKVKFLTVDPQDQIQNFKGWVHLIR
ncbi:gliding motility-associated C-terminal domain-containing protein [Chryseolinea lacunae]|uniref:Gliding motility-associated C-terminal domain-containing protein n=1 Tax=Chryseolinea lacunae TaxID=2801331 RepID=A0ABS1L0B0_9BACT|nr:gliding motility-associated C-terminal domain-containing protein [Chryseolinea lacunae]MBL0744942.1 gliding motility-associated C-terminal domain-containing protein [Chryseolinea lacunae]